MADTNLSRTAHFGDPCIHCGVAMEDVERGPCPGNDGKLKVAGYVRLGTRWDGVTRYRYRTTDGRIHDVHRHVSEHAPYYHFGLSDTFQQTPPYDPALAKANGGSHE